MTLKPQAGPNYGLSYAGPLYATITIILPYIVMVSTLSLFCVLYLVASVYMSVPDKTQRLSAMRYNKWFYQLLALSYTDCTMNETSIRFNELLNSGLLLCINRRRVIQYDKGGEYQIWKKPSKSSRNGQVSSSFIVWWSRKWFSLSLINENTFTTRNFSIHYNSHHDRRLHYYYTWVNRLIQWS